MVSIEFPARATFFHPTNAPHYRQKYSKLQKEKNFSTHLGKDKIASKFYRLSQQIMFPWKSSCKFLEKVVTPLPENFQAKPFIKCIWKTVIRILNLISFLILAPLGLLTYCIGMPIHYYSFKWRPFIGCVDNSDKISPKICASELDFRTYNLGFTYEAMRIIGSLRPSHIRAEEIVNSIRKEEKEPDIICFQEAFNVPATRKLCDGLKEKYPYILHSLDPHIFGLCNGAVIASKYPIEEVSYRQFANMLGPEKMSRRGLIGIRVDLGNNRYANVYSAHLQALLGKKRALVRKEQLEKTVKWMDEDHAEDQIVRSDRIKVGDFLMGDLNISHINAWGYHNAPEEENRKFLETHFYDPFYEEHDENGNRTKGSPRFLDKNCFPFIKEPSGSWYTGPFAKKGIALKVQEWYEKRFNRFKQGVRIKEMENPILWATDKWNSGPRTANTARFDYQLVRKRSNTPHVKGIAEIEHVLTQANSGPSDHLPIRAIYTLN